MPTLAAHNSLESRNYELWQTSDYADSLLDRSSPARQELAQQFREVVELQRQATYLKTEAHFRRFAQQWKNDCAHISSVLQSSQHPAYQQIIRMGRPVIPFLLADLVRTPAYWFFALREITGEDPVPPSSRGKVREMAQAWIQWGRSQGYKL
ncbi:MAG TPA: hypothetical protein VMG59_10745 [Phycisphaerae bacterium]|nr:hypothetical protein [Phycisphaerae bacterium]